MNTNNPSPEERQRIVSSVVAKAFTPKTPTEDERIIGKAVAATRRIRDEFAPQIAAHGFPDKKKFGLVIGRAFLEEFHSWPKDELTYLCCVIHTDALLEKLR
jgi:hypothetical protein